MLRKRQTDDIFPRRELPVNTGLFGRDTDQADIRSPAGIDLCDRRAGRYRWRGLPGTDVVEIDTDKIDEAVLALLYLALHDDLRACKGFDWDAMDRLHRKGLIHDPVGKAKSVVLTDVGLAESERLFRKLFAKPSAPDQAVESADRSLR